MLNYTVLQNIEITIRTLEGNNFYLLAYQGAIFISLIIFYVCGLRKKFNFVDWLTIELVCFIFFAIGMRVATLTSGEWQLMVFDGIAPAPMGKTEIGGLMGFLVAFLILRHTFGKRYPILDVYGFIIPCAIIVQRFGCLMAGCCFGIPYNGPMRVKYADHFKIHDWHEAINLIPSDTAFSGSVHPVPVYFMIAGLLTLVLLLLTQKHLKRHGSSFLLSIGALTAMRFLIEFVRDPSTNHQFGLPLFGLKMIQWVVLAISAIAFIALLLNERRVERKLQPQGMRTVSRHFILLLSIGLFLAFVPYLDRVEILNVALRVSVLLAILLVSTIRGVAARRWEFIVPVLLITSLLFLGQTKTADNDPDLGSSEKTKREKPSILYRYGEHFTGAVYGKPVQNDLKLLIRYHQAVRMQHLIQSGVMGILLIKTALMYT